MNWPLIRFVLRHPVRARRFHIAVAAPWPALDQCRPARGGS